MNETMSYNRKEFLKTSAAISTGLVLSNSMLSCSPASTGKYGMQVYTVRNDIAKNVESTFAYVAKAGYKQIELYGFDDVKTYWGKKTPKEVKDILNVNGLVSPSCHYHLKGFMYEGKIDDWKAAVEASAIIGHEYMIIPWVENKYRTGEYFKRLVDLIGKASELTRAAGIKLAYHNHDFEFINFNGTTGYDILLSETDPMDLKFEMDIYWVVRAGKDPVTLFQQNPGRYVMWHVKDMDKITKTFTEVGSGSIDYQNLFTKDKLSGMKHYFIEQDAIKIDPYESITRSFQHLKSNIL